MGNNKNNRNEEDDFEMPKLDIRQENEFKKMKMTLETGAVFPDDLSKNLPPEIEGQFLDCIMNFEKAFRNAKRISIFDKIGRPHFIPENILNSDQIIAELKKIEELLDQNGIIVKILAAYDDEERLIYKFITEELFLLEVDDINISGMNFCFIYEEFHQNNDFDLRRETNNFLYMFFNKKNNLYHEFYATDAKNYIKLNNFRSLFKKFKIKLLEINSVLFDDEKAKTTFNIDFWGKMDGNKNKICYSGQGSITFDYSYGYWSIQEVLLPFNN